MVSAEVSAAAEIGGCAVCVPDVTVSRLDIVLCRYLHLSGARVNRCFSFCVSVARGI